MNRTMLWLAALIVAVAPALYAGEADDAALRREAMELMKKQKEGVELTEAEKARLRELKEQMPDRPKMKDMKRGEMPPPPEGERERPGRPFGQERPAGPEAGPMERFNVLDQAAFAVADALVKAERGAEAVKHLLAVAEKSPDPDARSFAYLRLGDLYREKLNDAEKAKAYYAKVGGAFAEQALGALVGPLAAAGKIDEAIAECEKFAKSATDEVAKALAVRMMVDLAVRSGDVEKMVKCAEKAQGLITYDEAARAAKKLAELREKAAAEFGPGAPGQGEFGAGERPLPGGAGRMGPEAIERMKDLAQKLEAAGEKEDADRLRKQIERLERGGRGGEGRKAPLQPPAGGGAGAPEIF